MIEIFKFFNVLLYCAHARLSCQHTHSRWVSLLHLKIIPVYTIPSFAPHHDRVRAETCLFFITPSFDSFSLAETSFCILQHLASLSFANPLSIHVMLSFFTVSIYSNKLFASQYSQKVLSFFPNISNPRPVSKSVLMIQSYTWFADVNEFIIGEHNCDANADCNNTEGSFECTICKPGYSGNGVYCTGDNSLVKTWFVLMLRLFQYHFVSSSRIWVKTIESKKRHFQM